MEDNFLWYEWNTGTVVALPALDCGQVTITADQLLEKWCLRVFTAVEARMTCESMWKVEVRQQIEKRIRMSIRSLSIVFIWKIKILHWFLEAYNPYELRYIVHLRKISNRRLIQPLTFVQHIFVSYQSALYFETKKIGQI